ALTQRSAALEDMTFQPLGVRLARRLLYLSSQGGTLRRELSLSQADLADASLWDAHLGLH
ncbi:MAG: hypothetical protein AAGD25_39960, partial [Cyanobacteria bacterium P01_F01_bin.150]